MSGKRARFRRRGAVKRERKRYARFLRVVLRATRALIRESSIDLREWMERGGGSVGLTGWRSRRRRWEELKKEIRIIEPCLQPRIFE